MHKIIALFALLALAACNGDKDGDTTGDTGDTSAM
jgi:hypothetical protein